MSYPKMTRTAGLRVYSQLSQNHSLGNFAVSTLSLTGTQSEYQIILTNLKQMLRNDREIWPTDSPQQVEEKLSHSVYQFLKRLDAAALNDPDFWRYLSLNHFREFILWRYRKGPMPNGANFGLNSVRRIPDCVPLRMFNQGYILESSGLSNNVTGTVGSDVWQSHILRVTNRYDPRISKWLIDQRNIQKTDVQALRAVAKRIRQLRANLLLREVDDSTIMTILNEIISEYATT